MTTGAEDDIRRATALARNMVGRWGMSQAIGPVAVLGSEDAGWPFDGIAPETRRLVDDEVRATIERARSRVTDLLRSHEDSVQQLADALMAEETLDADEAIAAARLDGASLTTT